MHYKKITLFILLLFCNNQLFSMRWIEEHPKTFMGIILLAGTSYLFKNQLLYFLKKHLFLYQTSRSSILTNIITAQIVDPIIPAISHPIADPNIQDNSGDTALFRACCKNDIEEVRFLLLNPETNPNIGDKNGITPLWWACASSIPAIIKLLLNSPEIDPNARECSYNQYTTALYQAYRRNFDLEDTLEIISLFIKNPKTNLNESIDHTTLLSKACKENWITIVEMALARKDINPNRGNYHDTYLRLAHQHADKKIFNLLRHHPKTDPADLFDIAVENGYEDIVEELLNKYSLDTLRSPHSESNYYPSKAALRDAAYAGNVNIFKRVLNQQNTNLDCSLYLGQALHAAASKGHIEIVTLLLQHPKIVSHPEIAMNLEDSCSETPFYAAIKNNHLEIALLLYNHIPNIVDIKNYTGESPLMHVAHNKTIRDVNFLIDECDANISIKDKNGNTFFYLLFKKDVDLNQLTFFDNYDHEQKKQFLNAELESFAQIKFADKDAENIKHTLTSFINYCTQYGADLNHRNNEGKRPLDIASDQYKIATQHIHSSSPQFIIKEKIYYGFLNKTKGISDHELWYRLSHNGIDKDIYGHIMKYYCALNADAYAARSDRQYFCKKKLLAQQYQRLNIFNDETKSFMLSLTL